MIDGPSEPLPPRFPDLMARRLGPDDAGALRALRRQVLATLADPDHYRVEGEVGDMVAEHLGGRGLVIGVFDPAVDGLIAYGALGLPGPGDANRGADLPLPPSEWPRVAHLTSSMVLPAYRGHQLHRWLLERRLEVGAELGRRHFLTTVSPRNHPSWGNLVANGLYIKRLVVVGGGLVRCLVHRDLAVTARFDADAATPCALSDHDRQRELLRDGQWGWEKGRGPAGQPCMMFGHPLF
jgi:GNAT superfamily N-acetyltransferase